MSAERLHGRYPANLRLRLQFATGELETTTDEVSLAGFSAPCADLPEVGSQFGFVVYLPDGGTVTGKACAMRLNSDGLAGFSAEFEPAQLAAWESFLTQEQANGGVWRMLSRYALYGGEQKEAARSVLEKTRLGVLFKKLGETKPEEEAPAVMRLHMVGENGEAYRIAFEKHPADPPESAPFAQKDPRLLELLARAATRVLSQDVVLKRAAGAEAAPVRLVELKRGGFGYVVQHASGKPSLMGLQGSELIAIDVDGKSIFPFFEPAELDRIALDTFRREVEDEPKPAAAAPAAGPLREERFSKAYEHKEVQTQGAQAGTQRELVDAMEAPGMRIQTRVYGDRTLKLFPDLWVEVTRPSAWPEPVSGFAMEDGVAICVFLMTGPGAPRVVRLEPTDRIAIIRKG